ncbi:MAG: hypothetical protein H0Z34_13290 [Brevibacillus sp.]|nr:hypothetical protein [Brevibacillus sp.]
MFYAKANLGDVEIKVALYDAEIYTVCPECGIEHQVDLSEIYQDGGDLISTYVYCSKCSQEKGTS